MKWNIATDDQLIAIVKHDITCPHSLLSEAVMEMLSRGMFDRIIADCVHRVIKNLKQFEQTYQTGLEDFMQVGRIEVLNALEVFQTDRGMNFFSFVYLKVKSQIIKDLVFIEAKKRDSKNSISYHNETESGTELVEFLPTNIDVEKYVVNKVTIEQLLKRVTEHQKNILLFHLKGYTFAEISKKLGRGSDRTMHQAYKIAISKMRKGA